MAIVTGAASGMGRATAHLLADEGAAVAVLDRDDGAACRGGRRDRGERRARPVAIGVDLADGAATDAAIEAARAALGPIDLLVNNAGISIPAPIDQDGFEAAWAQTLAVNLTAYTRTIRACLAGPRRATAPGASSTSRRPRGSAPPRTWRRTPRPSTAWSASPARCPWSSGRRGVTVNCVCPGPIRTGMTEPIPEEAKTKFARRRVPMRRYGDPEEVAQITVSLLLPAASFITGAVIPVDGGLTVQNT